MLFWLWRIFCLVGAGFSLWTLAIVTTPHDLAKLGTNGVCFAVLMLATAWGYGIMATKTPKR